MQGLMLRLFANRRDARVRNRSLSCLMLLISCVLLVASLVLLPRVARAASWDEDITLDVGADGVIEVQCSRVWHKYGDDTAPATLRWFLPLPSEEQSPDDAKDVVFGELRDDGSLRRYDLVEDLTSAAKGTFTLKIEGSGVQIDAMLDKCDESTEFCLRYKLSGAIRRWADVAEIGVLFQNDWLALVDSRVSIWLPGTEGMLEGDGHDEPSAWVEWQEPKDDVCIVVQHPIEYDGSKKNGEFGKLKFEFPSKVYPEDHRFTLRAIVSAQAFPLVRAVGREKKSAIIEMRDELVKQYDERLEVESKEYQRQKEIEEESNRQLVNVVTQLVNIVTPVAWVVTIILCGLTCAAYFYLKSLVSKSVGTSSPSLELLNDEVSPLVVSWIMTNGSITYAGIAAGIAALASKGLLDVQGVKVERHKGRHRGTCASTLVYKTKKHMSDEAGELEHITMKYFTDGLCKISSEREKQRTVYDELPVDQRYVLFDDFNRMAPAKEWRGYRSASKKLSSYLNDYCLKEGYRDNVNHEKELRLLFGLKIAYVVTLCSVFAIGGMTSCTTHNVEAQSSALFFTLIPLLFGVMFTRAITNVFKKSPFGPKFQRLRKHIRSFGSWIDELPDALHELPMEGGRLTQALLYAIAIGKGSKLAEHVREERFASMESDAVTSALVWSEGIAEELANGLKHFEDLYKDN